MLHVRVLAHTPHTLTRASTHTLTRAELTAGWSDLFLDLIFVGAAYQFGYVVQYSFYSCASGGASSHGSDASGDFASGDSGSNHRALAAAEHGAAPVCLPWGLAWLYVFAMFASLQRLWHHELVYRARFDASDSSHRGLDLVGYFLLVLAASNIKPLRKYEGVAVHGERQGASPPPLL